MTSFIMNGDVWRIRFVDPSDQILIDRTNTRTVATTDPATFSVNLSNELGGDFLVRVLIHEISHCAIFSFGLVSDIRRMVKPRYWIDAEEWACNFIADYGYKIFEAAYSFLGYEAINFVPYALNSKVG